MLTACGELLISSCSQNECGTILTLCQTAERPKQMLARRVSGLKTAKLIPWRFLCNEARAMRPLPTGGAYYWHTWKVEAIRAWGDSTVRGRAEMSETYGCHGRSCPSDRRTRRLAAHRQAGNPARQTGTQRLLRGSIAPKPLFVTKASIPNFIRSGIQDRKSTRLNSSHSS